MRQSDSHHPLAGRKLVALYCIGLGLASAGVTALQAALGYHP